MSDKSQKPESRAEQKEPTVPIDEKASYYDQLGVSQKDSAEYIRRVGKRLARKYHPDVNPGDKVAERNFQIVSQATEVLLDEENRKKYDRFGKDWKRYTEKRHEPADFYIVYRSEGVTRQLLADWIRSRKSVGNDSERRGYAEGILHDQLPFEVLEAYYSTYKEEQQALKEVQAQKEGARKEKGVSGKAADSEPPRAADQAAETRERSLSLAREYVLSEGARRPNAEIIITRNEISLRLKQAGLASDIDIAVELLSLLVEEGLLLKKGKQWVTVPRGRAAIARVVQQSSSKGQGHTNSGNLEEPVGTEDVFAGPTEAERAAQEAEEKERERQEWLQVGRDAVAQAKATGELVVDILYVSAALSARNMPSRGSVVRKLIDELVQENVLEKLGAKDEWHIVGMPMPENPPKETEAQPEQPEETPAGEKEEEVNIDEATRNRVEFLRKWIADLDPDIASVGQNYILQELRDGLGETVLNATDTTALFAALLSEGLLRSTNDPDVWNLKRSPKIIVNDRRRFKLDGSPAATPAESSAAASLASEATTRREALPIVEAREARADFPPIPNRIVDELVRISRVGESGRNISAFTGAEIESKAKELETSGMLESFAVSEGNVSIEGASILDSVKHVENQDSMAGNVWKETGAFWGLVADGIGGNAGGKMASEAFKTNVEQEMGLLGARSDQPEVVLQAVVRGIKAAAAEITAAGVTDRVNNMADTTFTFSYGVPRPGGGFDISVIHAGDSGVYLHESERSYKITPEHSIPSVLEANGSINSLQAKVHYLGNKLTKRGKGELAEAILQAEADGEDVMDMLRQSGWLNELTNVPEGSELLLVSDGVIDNAVEEDDYNEVRLAAERDFNALDYVAAARVRHTQGVKGLSKLDDTTAVRIKMGERQPVEPTKEIRSGREVVTELEMEEWHNRTESAAQGYVFSSLALDREHFNEEEERFENPRYKTAAAFCAPSGLFGVAESVGEHHDTSVSMHGALLEVEAELMRQGSTEPGLSERLNAVRVQLQRTHETLKGLEMPDEFGVQTALLQFGTEAGFLRATALMAGKGEVFRLQKGKKDLQSATIEYRAKESVKPHVGSEAELNVREGTFRNVQVGDKFVLATGDVAKILNDPEAKYRNKSAIAILEEATSAADATAELQRLLINVDAHIAGSLSVVFMSEQGSMAVHDADTPHSREVAARRPLPIYRGSRGGRATGPERKTADELRAEEEQAAKLAQEREFRDKSEEALTRVLVDLHVGGLATFTQEQLADELALMGERPTAESIQNMLSELNGRGLVENVLLDQSALNKRLGKPQQSGWRIKVDVLQREAERLGVVKERKTPLTKRALIEVVREFNKRSAIDRPETARRGRQEKSPEETLRVAEDLFIKKYEHSRSKVFNEQEFLSELESKGFPTGPEVIDALVDYGYLYMHRNDTRWRVDLKKLKKDLKDGRFGLPEGAPDIRPIPTYEELKEKLGKSRKFSEWLSLNAQYKIQSFTLASTRTPFREAAAAVGSVKNDRRAQARMNTITGQQAEAVAALENRHFSMNDTEVLNALEQNEDFRIYVGDRLDAWEVRGELGKDMAVFYGDMVSLGTDVQARNRSVAEAAAKSELDAMIEHEILLYPELVLEMQESAAEYRKLYERVRGKERQLEQQYGSWWKRADTMAEYAASVTRADQQDVKDVFKEWGVLERAGWEENFAAARFALEPALQKAGSGPIKNSQDVLARWKTAVAEVKQAAKDAEKADELYEELKRDMFKYELDLFSRWGASRELLKSKRMLILNKASGGWYTGRAAYLKKASPMEMVRDGQRLEDALESTGPFSLAFVNQVNPVEETRSMEFDDGSKTPPVEVKGLGLVAEQATPGRTFARTERDFQDAFVELASEFNEDVRIVTQRWWREQLSQLGVDKPKRAGNELYALVRETFDSPFIRLAYANSDQGAKQFIREEWKKIRAEITTKKRSGATEDELKRLNGQITAIDTMMNLAELE